MHKILHKVLHRILCAKALLKPSEPMATSGALDDARNRPNKIVRRFALAYKFRASARIHAQKISKHALQCKSAAEKRAPCMPNADRAMLGSVRRGPDFVSAQFAKRAWGYAEPIAWLRRTHCMATQNPLHGYAEPIDNLNISFCRIRFRKSKISPRMKATADIQIIEVAAPRDSL